MPQDQAFDLVLVGRAPMETGRASSMRCCLRLEACWQTGPCTSLVRTNPFAQALPHC